MNPILRDIADRFDYVSEELGAAAERDVPSDDNRYTINRVRDIATLALNDLMEFMATQGIPMVMQIESKEDSK